jgi:hypothetical protein
MDQLGPAALERIRGYKVRVCVCVCACPCSLWQGHTLRCLVRVTPTTTHTHTQTHTQGATENEAISQLGILDDVAVRRRAMSLIRVSALVCMQVQVRQGFPRGQSPFRFFPGVGFPVSVGQHEELRNFPPKSVKLTPYHTTRWFGGTVGGRLPPNPCLGLK